MVRTLRCGRSNPGSNPGHGMDLLPTVNPVSSFFLSVPSCTHVRVGGIVVSIAAFQAVDPGSIPGHRILTFLCSGHMWSPQTGWGDARYVLESHNLTPITVSHFKQKYFS